MKRVLPLLRSQGLRLAVAFVAMLLASGLNVVSLYTLKPVIDQVFLTQGARHFEIALGGVSLFAYSGSPVTFLLLLALGFSFARLVYAGAFFVQRYLMLVVGEEAVTVLRKDLAAHLVRLTPDWFTGRRSGDLVSNLTADLGLIQNLFATTAGDLLRRPIEVLLLLLFLFSFDPTLTVLSLLIAPFIVAAIQGLSRVLRRRTVRLQERMGDLAGRIQEIAAGIRTIQSFRAESRESDRFAREADGYLDQARHTYLAQAAPAPLTEIITAVGISLILWAGGTRVLAGAMSPGTFFTFMAMLVACYQPVKAIGNAWADLARAHAAFDRLDEVFAARPRVAEKIGARPLGGFSDRIRFDNVGMRYDDGTRALADVSFEIRRGETVALVGPSGAGKTTIANLLARFFDPSEGRVTIDGTDLRDLTLDSIRRTVGLVSQETFLFHDTIEANLRYARPDASDGEVRAAATAAQILARVASFPDGMRTIVGERGVRLSGGERQRIAIARTILQDPRVLILDEATSALDAESEKAVAEALEVLMKGRTVVVIAHRLSTVTSADRIFVFEGGRIVETGRHEGLLAGGGLYARLYRLFQR